MELNKTVELIAMAKRNGVPINCWVEPMVKQEAENVLYDIGLTMSDAINIFLRKCIAEGGMPFEVKLTPGERDNLRQRSIGSRRRRDAQIRSLEQKKEQPDDDCTARSCCQ